MIHKIDNATMDTATARHFLLGKIGATEDGDVITVQKSYGVKRHALYIYEEGGEYVAMDINNKVRVKHNADLNLVIGLAKRAVIKLELESSII